MKLSELKGERALEVIADLIQPIANIAADQKNLKLFQAEKREGETDREMAVRDLTTKVPLLLRTHKKDILAILSAVNGVPAEDLSVMAIMKGAVELANDQEFVSLFLSSGSPAGQTSPIGYSADADHSKPES